MASHAVVPAARKWRRMILTIALTAALAAGTVGATTVSATPSAPRADPGTSQDAKKAWDSSSRQAEIAAEALNGARVAQTQAVQAVTTTTAAVVMARSAMGAAQQKAAAASDTVASYQVRLDAFANASLNGAPLSDMSALLTAASADDFLDQSSSLDQVASDNRALLRGAINARNDAATATTAAAAAQVTAEQAEASAERAKTAATVATTTAQGKKAELDTAVSRYKDLFGRLSAHERQVAAAAAAKAKAESEARARAAEQAQARRLAAEQAAALQSSQNARSSSSAAAQVAAAPAAPAADAPGQIQAQDPAQAQSSSSAADPSTSPPVDSSSSPAADAGSSTSSSDNANPAPSTEASSTSNGDSSSASSSDGNSAQGDGGNQPAAASGGGGNDPGQIAAAAAMTKVGGGYCYACDGPSSFDCSGLTTWAWGQAGISIPRVSNEQANFPEVPLDQLQPGDLVTYYSPVSHVSIYVGNGMVVSAADESLGIIYVPVGRGGPDATGHRVPRG